jgi:hypothetical protein
MSKKLLHGPLFTYSIPTLFGIDSEETVAFQLVALANEGDKQAQHWVDGLASTPSTELLQEAINTVGPIPVYLSPVLKSGKKIAFEHSFRDDAIKTEQVALKIGLTDGEARKLAKAPLYALAFLRVVNAGLVNRIHRCALQECRQVFFGDVRARWCSPSCGSKHRVRRKRKRDRE